MDTERAENKPDNNASCGYQPGNIWYRLFRNLIFTPIVKWFWKVEVIGAENIPANGCVIAANHIDAGDTIALPAALKPAMIFPAKKELFEGKNLGGKIVAWFLKLVGQVPIDRSGGKASVSGLEEIEQKLSAGHAIGIFPEGSRSTDGRLYKGHTGVARMALEVNKPVVPVGLINTRLLKNKLGLPTMKNAKIVIGKPLDYSRFHDFRNNIKVGRWVTNDIMAHIQEVTGQEYVDVYLSAVKRGKLSGEALEKHVKETPSLEEPQL